MAKQPHAVMLPFPAIGHLSPMLNLAGLLASRDILVTFVNTEFIHDRMFKSAPNEHNIRFQTISDGLPDDHNRSFDPTHQMMRSVTGTAGIYFEKLVEKLRASSDDVPPISCIIGDTFLPFAQDIAQKYDIPGMAFWACSACSFSVHFHTDLLVQKGYIPLQGKTRGGRCEEEDEIISCIPGMSQLRVRDVPSSLLEEDSSYFMNHHLKMATNRSGEAAQVLLFNTSEELDAPILESLRTKFEVLSVGPLLPLAFMGDSGASGGHMRAEEKRIAPPSANEDSGCLQWLDEQERCSVVFVSFGSVARFSKEQLEELAWGLEASNQPFLWVYGQSALLPQQFLTRTKQRSCFVSWAPQLKVLLHPSVGCYLTHCGWNSTIESIYAGVPLVCWPFFADNHVNRRLLVDVWKMGVELNDRNICREDITRSVKMVIIGDEGAHIRKRCNDLKISVRNATNKGGSSYVNFDKLVKIIMKN
eukprot:Gb_41001 [translate_table: standard]